MNCNRIQWHIRIDICSSASLTQGRRKPGEVYVFGACRICSEPLHHLDGDTGFCTECPSAVVPAIVVLIFIVVIVALCGFLWILLTRPPRQLKKTSQIAKMIFNAATALGPSKIKAHRHLMCIRVLCTHGARTRA